MWVDEYISSEHFSQATIDKKQSHKKGLSAFSDLPLNEITILSLKQHCDKLSEQGKYETIKQQLQLMGLVFSYADSEIKLLNPDESIADSPIRQHNLIMKDAIRELQAKYQKKRPPTRHYAALEKQSDVKKFIRDVYAYGGTELIRYLIRISVHVMLRPSEVRRVRWDWVDFDADVIRYPKEVIKTREDHLLPMSQQVKTMLEELFEKTGRTEHVFYKPGNKEKVPSENAVNQAFHRMGYQGRQTAHGLRTLASTALHELGYSSDHIEKQLAHNDQNQIRSIYSRAQYLSQRRKLLQGWSDIIDEYRMISTTEKNYENL